MKLYYTFIFLGLLLLFSSTVSSYPSYSNEEYQEKYPMLRMIMPYSPLLTENDGIWQEKLLSIDGKELIEARFFCF